MLRSILLALCVALVTVSALSTSELTEAEYEGMWHEFTGRFNKVYHPTEVMTRYKIFKVPNPTPIASQSTEFTQSTPNDTPAAAT